MATSFKINPERLRGLGANIRETADQYKIELDTIYKCVDDMSTAWSGEESQAYVNKVYEYKEVLTALGNAIENHGTFLNNTSTSAENLKNELREMANRMNTGADDLG